MKTIKIIDLLNMISKGEEVPKKIRYINLIWEYDNEIKDYIHDDLYLFYKINAMGLIKNYVEILEEEPRNIEVCGSLFTKSEYDKLAHSEETNKIPEKLDYKYINSYGNISQHKKSEEPIINKINEILDYLESEGNK